MEYETIKVEISAGVARLTLARPDKFNAISIGMIGELTVALKAMKLNKDIRVLVLAHEGRGFCSGLDLTAPRPGVNPDDPEELLRDHFVPMFQLLRDLPFPTLSVIKGAAVGAGLSLALSCDIILAGPSAYFQSAFVNIGLVPDTGASWLLQRAIGENRARAMMMLGEKVSAQKAEDWGLVWKCLDDEDLDAEVAAMAQKFATGPRVAYQQMRGLMRDVSRNSWDDQVHAEAQAQKVARASHDAQEARVAFREKRKPVFTGT